MTEDEILAEFRAADALLEGHFILSSGLHSPKYLQCARVLMDPSRASRLASALARSLPIEIKSQISMVVSNMLKEEDARKRGEPRLLAVDERVVVPVGATVKMIVTSADVIHSWGIPAFWAKVDAVPGRLNETWFKVDKPGVYYGQCFELCGARHAFMPIAVEVVPPAQFAAWVASKGGTMPGAAQPKSGDETATSPITNPGAAAAGAGPQPTAGGSATATSPEPPAITPGTSAPPVSSQGATESKRGN